MCPCYLQPEPEPSAVITRTTEGLVASITSAVVGVGADVGVVIGTGLGAAEDRVWVG